MDDVGVTVALGVTDGVPLRVRDGVVLGADEEAIRERAHAAARRLWAYATHKQ